MKAKIRLESIIQSARAHFWRKGFGKTQMGDIAKDMGIAVGTLYLYVKSKEALFDLVLRHGIENSVPLDSLALPIEHIDLHTTRQYIEQELTHHARWPVLQTAIASQSTPFPLRVEWRMILAEIYVLFEQHRWGIRVVNSSAHDFPWLAEIFIMRFRRALLNDLMAFFAKRSPEANPDKWPILAYFVVETLATAVLHRQGDPIYVHLPEFQLKETILLLLENAILAELEPYSEHV